MQRILIIEDDQTLSKLISNRLQRYEYDAREIKSFFHIMNEFTNLHPDLVLLDINLPYEDGYILCKKIRTLSNVPILMISARTEEVEQIMAIEFGADDYIVKPFTMDMLIVKIRALLRRTQNNFSTTSQTFQYKQLLLNFNTMSLHYSGEQYPLTKNEAYLLKALFECTEHFIAKDRLIEEVWGPDLFIEENTLSTNIVKLRKLLTSIHKSFQIETKRGVGYRLVQKDV